MDNNPKSEIPNQKSLIVGLGNPGRKYRHNRHNIGFMTLDRLADAHSISSSRVQNKAIVGTGKIAERSVILAKPQTFMNNSGLSVGQLARFYKIEPSDVLIVYDELDLPFGTIRLRKKGGAGGHNGMRSVIQHIGQEFPRLRLGIGRPPGRMPPSAWVLQDFHQNDQPLLDDLFTTALQTIETWLTDGVELAMTRHNGSVVRDA